MDLKKAFDMVNDSILTRKLSNVGFGDQSLNWFTTYLKDGVQIVNVEGIDSQEHNIECGVPQASIVGSLLSLLFIDDLCNVVELCGISMYADDTAIYYLSRVDMI